MGNAGTIARFLTCFLANQKEAIYTLHAIYKQAVDVCNSPVDIQKNLLRQKNYEHIKPLLETIWPSL